MKTLRRYLRTTAPSVVAADMVRGFLILLAPLLYMRGMQWVAHTSSLYAPVHRDLWSVLVFAGRFHLWFMAAACLLNAAWIGRALRNFVLITVTRSNPNAGSTMDTETLPLPPWPYSRESFTVILGELQDRDGGRVPSELSPSLRPRWLTLPEKALYTGVFVTGGIGSGKTAAAAYPALHQMLGFRRPVTVTHRDGSVEREEWKFSGLILDEKGDFTRAAAGFCKEWGRQGDLIRLAPGGDWIWNVIYNPNIPTWAVAYQLGWIIKNFNKGTSGSDPFWENAPKELATDYLTLLDDAEGYYNLLDYLELIVDEPRQNDLDKKARARFTGNQDRIDQIDRRWKGILHRRTQMTEGLRGALEASAKAGIDMFRFPELRKAFCPTKGEYFELDDKSGMHRPKPNVFTGFDQILDYGKIVGLEAPKQIYFDAAVFLQVALKSQWQDAVLRREGIGSDGRLLAPPRFGERIGYCPTFLLADEAQLSATPKDGEFKAVCRSKRASMWELTQSHGSIKGAFGPQKGADANTYFQNSMTHLYLRQSDVDSMKLIQEECGKRLVQKTTLAYTEGGQASALSYVQGGIVHEGMGVSATKTVATEEKPFIEIEELKTLPNNVAIVLPSNGDRTLPATVTYLRPLWVFKKHRDLRIETPWCDWPEDLRSNYDLDNIPQDLAWQGWEGGEGVAGDDVVRVEDRLGRLVQSFEAPPGKEAPATESSPSPAIAVSPGTKATREMPPPRATDMPDPDATVVADGPPAMAAEPPGQDVAVIDARMAFVHPRGGPLR